MCARLGAATGRGLAGPDPRALWHRLGAVGGRVIVFANGGVTVTEFVGIGAAMELLGVSRYVSVPHRGGCDSGTS